ncbi:MAG TPA: ABC transporter ATP-binding protein [Longimicrobium sp.]|uniref:ABC transporter ATP-binding protein n=1 Tax=Longimicrobium sp. TaxID=2029185 RepID=UPI002EDA602A
MSGWTCEGLTYRYPEADRPALRGLSLRIPADACTAVLGPNGSGKSTLLRILLGTLKPSAGTVAFGDRPVAEWGREAMARAVGVVPQGEEAAFPVSVRELVGMGRYPHLGAWRREGEADRRAVDEAMRRCDVAGLAARPVSTLSGGERQRARVARALAQQAPTLALDEPTAALDVAHEMAIFELLRDLGHGGRTVLLVTHNLNLAARYADHLILLSDGQLAAAGTPAEVLTRATVERVYGWPVEIAAHPGPGPDTGAPQVVALAGEQCVRMEHGAGRYDAA